MRTRATMAMLAVAMVGLVGVNTAGASNDSAHRPMKATTSSEYAFVGSCGVNAYVAQIAGTATMTHLGRVALTATDCVTFMTPDEGTADGRATFTAANGDLLYATFEGSFGPTGSDGVLPVAFTMVFVGGTGRFAHATGEMTGTGVLTPTNESSTYSGWIAY